MKIIIGAIIGIVLVIAAFIAYDPVKYYNRSGQLFKPMKIWTDTIAITSATPSVNISSAGFSTIISIQPQMIQGSPTLANFSWCNVTSYSTSSISLFLVQQNNNTVNVLGSLVLLGTPLQAPTAFTGLYMAITVIGY